MDSGSDLPLPAATLEVHVAQGADPRVMTLTGELDAASAPAFAAALSEVDADPPGLLCIDLSSLTFMDSTGLRLLLEAHKRALSSGRRLVIVPGPPDVQAVFQVTGLEGTLEFF